MEILSRTIFEKEKSQRMVKKKSQKEKLNYVYIGGGRGRGQQFHHFTLVLLKAGRLITLSYSLFQGHYTSVNNLRLGACPLFICCRESSR